MHASMMIVECSGFSVTEPLDDVRNTEASTAHQVLIGNLLTWYTRDAQFVAYFCHYMNMHEH